MIQFSKPRRSPAKAMDQFRRHEANARDSMGGSANSGMMPSGRSGSGTPSRFDASFYRTHDALGYIPFDVQSLRSQATYSSGLPMFAATVPFSAQSAVPTEAMRPRSSPRMLDLVPVSQITAVSSEVQLAASNRICRLTRKDYKSQGEDVDLDDTKSQYTGTQSGLRCSDWIRHPQTFIESC
jgi:regulator of nonsense transcripts 1